MQVYYLHQTKGPRDSKQLNQGHTEQVPFSFHCSVFTILCVLLQLCGDTRSLTEPQPLF